MTHELTKAEMVRIANSDKAPQKPKKPEQVKLTHKSVPHIEFSSSDYVVELDVTKALARYLKVHNFEIDLLQQYTFLKILRTGYGIVYYIQRTDKKLIELNYKKSAISRLTQSYDKKLKAYEDQYKAYEEKFKIWQEAAQNRQAKKDAKEKKQKALRIKSLYSVIEAAQQELAKIV